MNGERKAVPAGTAALVKGLSVLDLVADAERPLRFAETKDPLDAVGLDLLHWQTYGYLGFCLFMNSDVLIFNRLFRYVPGIRAITSVAVRVDDLVARVPGMRMRGLQVVGAAEKKR